MHNLITQPKDSTLHTVAYVWNGTEGVISGTSASTPLMSGIIALVNNDL